MNKLKSLEEFIEEKYVLDYVNEMATAKDLKRINDIVAKSAGSEAKQIALATKMANAIKDRQKSLQRYEAALEILGADHPVTVIFAEKAQSLGNNIDAAAAPKKKNTLGKLGSQVDKRKPDDSRSRYGRPSPILPIGSTNLITGKCKYFNIYDTWGRDDSSTVELWKDRNTGKFKFVITSGSKSLSIIGSYGAFQHDQTQRPLFDGELVDWFQLGDAELAVRKYNIKSAPGYVYK